MKKQIINASLCLMVAFTTLHCAKKTTGMASTAGQSQTAASAGSEADASTETMDLNVYAGKYKMQSDKVGVVTVVVENNKIYGEAEGQPRTEIKPEGRDSFNVPEYNAKIIFSRDSNQKVNGVTLYINGGEVSGEKIE